MFISKKRWNALEKRVADIEKSKSLSFKLDEAELVEKLKMFKKKTGKSLLEV